MDMDTTSTITEKVRNKFVAVGGLVRAYDMGLEITRLHEKIAVLDAGIDQEKMNEWIADEALKSNKTVQGCLRQIYQHCIRAEPVPWEAS